MMGFSLLFIRIKNSDIADADRPGIKQFLTQQGLQILPQGNSCGLVDHNGDSLTFNGDFTDLHVDPLDQSEPVTGGIDHTTLSKEECQFIYALCVAGGLMIINPQGTPMYLVPHRNHAPEDVPNLDDAAWVNNADELRAALSEGFHAFKIFKHKTL